MMNRRSKKKRQLVKCVEASGKLDVEHGVIASFPDDFFGYFGWPTVAKMEDGALVVTASGFRNAHICPFGKTVICTSGDNGATWTPLANDENCGISDSRVVYLGWGGEYTAVFIDDIVVENDDHCFGAILSEKTSTRLWLESD